MFEIVKWLKMHAMVKFQVYILHEHQVIVLQSHESGCVVEDPFSQIQSHMHNSVFA